MQSDIKQWVSELTEEERDTFLKINGLLAFLDSIQSDYAKRASDYVTDSSVNALLIMIARDEVIHNHSYSYVLSSLVDKSKQDEVFEFWKHDKVLLKRNNFIAKGYEDFTENKTPETFIKSIVFDVILEGLFFYAGFAFFYNLARNQKMVSSSTMINYINRDEQVHVGIFTDIFKETLSENPELNTDELKQFILDTFRQAAELEIEWGDYIIGNRFEGINQQDLQDYIKFMANTRCNNLIGEKPFPEIKSNPMRWIVAYQEVDMGKTDFFEQKSRQYIKTSDDNGFDDL